MTDKANLYPVKIKIPLSAATAEIALRYKKKPSFFAVRKLRKATRKKYAGLVAEEFLDECIGLREEENADF